jgi:NMD protein affecting ribosome stability and mRNA decay
MQRTIGTIGVLALALGVAAPASAQMEREQATGRQMGVASSERATATVTKIDKEQRKLWLRDAQGKEIELKVGPSVQNFDQIRVGDRVTAQYTQAVVLAIRKPGEAAPEMGTRQRVERAPAGQRPEGMISQQTTVTGQVVSVDSAKNSVVLRTPEGKTETFNVKDPDLQRKLPQLRAGDQVDVTYSEALAIAVQPAK